jgi:D-inositol-3-phosphate glycosyltransferase
MDRPGWANGWSEGQDLVVQSHSAASPVSLVPVEKRAPRRVAMLSVHTSPLDQPGTGDAGGMNVYVVELARRLAALGTQVEVFTRATRGDLPPVVELSPGVLVRHVVAGPFEGLAKEDLPAQLCAMTSGVLRAEAQSEPGYYDLVHSHYWLSGQVGWLAKERWGVPLVHTMHTMAKVKNAALATGDSPEPASRIIGESQVVEAADRLIANTAEEGAQLVDLYGADPAKVRVINPGVDLDRFTPGSRTESRALLGLPVDALVLTFVGRIQPLKGPEVLLRSVARLLGSRPELRPRLVVQVVGGPSGSGLARPAHLLELAARLGIGDVVRFDPPMAQSELVHVYRAADVVTVPSYSESFGLVALEAQACGTPVVAAAVGGLRTAVADGVSGVLVEGHDARRWASVLRSLLEDPACRLRLSRGAIQHVQSFGWPATASAVLEVYVEAMAAAATLRPGPPPMETLPMAR